MGASGASYKNSTISSRLPDITVGRHDQEFAKNGLSPVFCAVLGGMHNQLLLATLPFWHAWLVGRGPTNQDLASHTVNLCQV